MVKVATLDYETELKEITFEEAQQKEYVTEAIGSTLSYCLHLAFKYCQDFEKIRYYVIISDIESLKTIRQTKLTNEIISNRLVFAKFYGDKK